MSRYHINIYSTGVIAGPSFGDWTQAKKEYHKMKRKYRYQKVAIELYDNQTKRAVSESEFDRDEPFDPLADLVRG